MHVSLTRLATTSITAGLVFILVGFPLVMLIGGSFAPPKGETAISLRAYLVLFNDIDLLWNSIKVAIGSTILALAFGVSLAWIVARTNVPFARTVEQLSIIPFYLSPLLGAVGWAVIAAPSEAGLINGMLMRTFGLAKAPFNIYTEMGIIWVSGIYFAPFCFLFAVGGLRSMEPSLEESARVIGSGNFGTAWRITLPLITPAILGSSLLVFVLAVGQFGVPAVLGMPRGYNVVTTRIYQLVAGFNTDYPAAAAMGISLFAFSALGVWLQIKILGKRKFTTVTGKGYRPRVMDVGSLRWLLFGCAVFYLLVAVILPLAALVYASLLRFITSDFATARFTLANFDYILFQYPTTQTAIRNTLLLAVGGATLTLGLCAILSWQIIRVRGVVSRMIELLTMVPVAIPGIVFSLGLLWAWIAVPFLPIYGTLWILLICYVTIFVPYGVRSISAAMMQIDPSLEECAVVCGAAWGRVMRTIVLPILRPSLMAAWTLIFVSIVKELSASALLYNGKTIVLSVAVYDLWINSSFTRVAALALIEAFIIFVVLWLARRLTRSEVIV